jgi:hypothetical protein
MSDRTSTDLIDGSRYSVDELRRAVLEGSGSLSRQMALALLRTKDYPEKTKDLERLLLDEREVPRLRNLAAQLLGDMATPAAIRALERGAEAQDELALRGVVSGLARANARAADSLLRKMVDRGGLVGELAARARGRVAKDEVSATKNLTPEGADEKRKFKTLWSTIRVKAAPASERKAALTVRSQAATNQPLATQGNALLECEGPPWMFVPSKDLVADPGILLKGPRPVGVLFRQMVDEVVGWRPRYDITTERLDDKTFSIAVVTTGSARPFLVGTGSLEGKRASFVVQSAPKVRGFQIQIRGTYDGRRLLFEDARVARQRWPARHPGSAP